MTIKRATLRLYVAVTGLLASGFELAGAIVGLLTKLLCLATVLLERAAECASPKRVTDTAQAPQSTYPTPKAIEVTTAASEAPLGALSQEDRLHGALVGMGFSTKCVRKFTASVRGRTETLEALIKEGIVALSSN